MVSWKYSSKSQPLLTSCQTSDSCILKRLNSQKVCMRALLFLCTQLQKQSENYTIWCLTASSFSLANGNSGSNKACSSYTKAVLNEGCVIKQRGCRILRCGAWKKEQKKNINALTAASEFFLWSACVSINRWPICKIVCLNISILGHSNWSISRLYWVPRLIYCLF